MPTKKILLAVDRSPRADAVAAIVADTARGAHAIVRLLHVAPEPSAVHNAEGGRGGAERHRPCPAGQRGRTGLREGDGSRDARAAHGGRDHLEGRQGM